MGHISHDAVGLHLIHFATTLAQSPYLASVCVLPPEYFLILITLLSSFARGGQRVSMELWKANAWEYSDSIQVIMHYLSLAVESLKSFYAFSS